MERRAATLGMLIIGVMACDAEMPGSEVQRAAEERIARIEAGLLPLFTIRGETTVRVPLVDRMRELNVPGVSVAVVNDGRIEWARGWGVADAVTGRPVTATTRFQAASISKPIAALAALRLVDAGRIDLDSDVNQWLRSWKVPENEFTAERKVTLRGLLTHTAGLSVSGFPGYGPGAKVPSPVGVLHGEGNTPPVRVFQAPGGTARYSGGGYTIMQQLVSDVEGRPFHEVMRTEVLEPIGMERSTYEQPIPEEMQDDIASGHLGDGTVVDGKWHTYPEQAAAGLWTTPSDLARYAMGVQRAVRGESDLLSQDMARAMLDPDTNNQGLGPAIDPAGPLFRHGGSNRGFRANFVAYIDEARGAFVMTNSDNGGPLAMQVVDAIADEYGWPAPRPPEHVPVALDRESLERWTGDYVVREPEILIEVRIENDTLRLSADGRGSLTLVPTSDSTFVDRRQGIGVVFRPGDADGEARVQLQGVTGTRSSGR